jgi:hypothetical protein
MPVIEYYYYSNQIIFKKNVKTNQADNEDWVTEMAGLRRFRLIDSVG